MPPMWPQPPSPRVSYPCFCQNLCDFVTFYISTLLLYIRFFLFQWYGLFCLFSWEYSWNYMKSKIFTCEWNWTFLYTFMIVRPPSLPAALSTLISQQAIIWWCCEYFATNRCDCDAGIIPRQKKWQEAVLANLELTKDLYRQYASENMISVWVDVLWMRVYVEYSYNLF